MHKFFTKLLTILLILTGVSVNAEESLHFNYIDTKGYGVFCVFRDADDIVWLGTSNGLITYAQLEGNRPFSYVRHTKLDDIIKKIDQDALGRLWVETQALDVLIYTPKSNDLIEDVPAYLRRFGIYVGNRFSHKSDSKGREWIGYNNKVYLRDFKTNRTKLFMFPSSEGRVLELEVNEKEVLVAMEHHLYTIPFATEKPQRLAVAPSRLAYTTLFMGRDGGNNLILGTAQQCFRYDIRQQLWSSLKDVMPLVTDVTPLPNGQVLVGTSNNGNYTYNPDGSLALHLTESAPNTGGLPNSHIEHVYYDKSKDMVITTFHKRGMSVYSHGENTFQEYHISSSANEYKDEDVISLSDAGNGSFWVGTEDNGVYRITADGSNRILEQHYPGKAATMVYQDSKGRLWTGLYGNGLHASDGTVYAPYLSPFSMVEDEQGRLFIAMLGMGIWMLNPETRQLSNVVPGNIWLMHLAYYQGKVYGSSGDMIYVLDTKTLTTEQIPCRIFGKDVSISVGAKTLTIDHRGWLWLVSHRNRSEVYIYDIPNKKTYSVDRLSRYVISGIVEDKEGNIWCTTDLGFVRVVVNDGQEPSFRLYCYSSWQYEQKRFYNVKALICMKDGRLLAGTGNGYRLMDTKQIPTVLKHSVGHSSPIITSLRVNDEDLSPVSPTDRAIFQSDIIYAHQIELDYNENNIMLECRPRGIHQQLDGMFYYLLDGLSDQWIPMDNYTIQLPNLPPGNYQLKVRRQADEIDSWDEFHILDICIHQPFWNTWYAWLFYICLMLAALYSFYRFTKHREEYRRKVHEMEIEAAHEAEMNDMKVQFFTNVSHDLRTPLTLILTPVEELLNTNLPANTRKVLDVVNRNAHHLYTLVNQILDFQRLGSTHDALSLDSADLVALVKDCCESYQLMASQRHIQLSFLASIEQMNLMMDSDKMQKVINNLLSNAFKFTPDGGFIQVEIEQTTDDKVLVHVKDTGRGISEADRAHIFERYYVSKVFSISNDSSGVGLSIVKHYVELHGGVVTVSGNKPKGTVFTIQLPVVQTAPIAVEENAPAPVIELPQVSGDRVSLLIVEDNADMLSYLGNVLAADYTIYQATDGQQALAILQSADIDLVVSDVMMDGMDGLELTRRIKENINTSHIPVILLTAKALAEDELSGLQMGANDYITKPFNFDVLRLRIRQQLERRQEKRKLFSENPDIEPAEITITTVDEQLLKQALDAVNKHIEDPDFNVDQLSNELGMHRTGLTRKLHAITGQTPLVFIRMLRLKRACQILKADPSKLISQVAYEVGFNNPKKFSKYFKDEFGCYPSEYGK